MNWIVVFSEIGLYHVVSVVELGRGEKAAHIPMNEDMKVGDIVYVASRYSVVYRMKVEELRVNGDGSFSYPENSEHVDCLARITHPLTVADELSFSIPQLCEIMVDVEHLRTPVPRKLTSVAADYLSDIFDNAHRCRDDGGTTTLRNLAIMSEY